VKRITAGQLAMARMCDLIVGVLLQMASRWVGATATPLAAGEDNIVAADGNLTDSGFFGDYWKRRFDVYTSLADDVMKKVYLKFEF
jgi:hypothetical protein